MRLRAVESARKTAESQLGTLDRALRRRVKLAALMAEQESNMTPAERQAAISKGMKAHWKRRKGISMTPNTESALLAELSRMGALVKKLTEEKEALREALRGLHRSADAVDLGRNVHNDRRPPEQRIDGPVWVALMDALGTARKALETP